MNRLQTFLQTQDFPHAPPEADLSGLTAAARRRPRPRPDVTVCIVNWNCRARLRACLRSLTPEDQKVDLEIVVVDNGSTDGAADMAAAEFPDVILVRNLSNVGFARANNQAAARARGRYLFFLNNDTVLPPCSLRGLLDYAEAHPEAGIIGPQLRGSGGQPQLSWRRRPSLGALLHRTTLLRCTGLFRSTYRRYRARDGGEGTRPVEVLMGAALFMPREVFAECGPWDEGYTFGGEDIDLCTRVGRRYPVIYHPEVEITHFGRISSRRHIGYAYTNTVIGVTRYLRQTGCSRPGLLLYKAALTADAPLQWVGHGVQYLWRRLRGRPLRAAKSGLILRGLTYFLRHGIIPLWRA
jgi:N-acetylglucosaminyl-diphospho-decaprenol L-rhamnosyltransferase